MISYHDELAGHIIALNDEGIPDYKDLADKMETYIVKNELINTHSVLAIKAFKKFDIKYCANQYKKIYKESISHE